MRLRWLRIQGFRSFVDETIEFDRAFTTLVGENDTGKSTIALAIQKCANELASGGNQIGPEDYPYGAQGPLCMEIGIELEDDDLADLFERLWPPVLGSEDVSALREEAGGQGREVVVGLYRSPGDDRAPNTTVRWGRLALVSSEIARLTDTIPDRSGISPEKYRSSAKNVFVTGSHAGVQIGHRLVGLFRLLSEFRVRADFGALSAAMEAPTGSETASVLLNLKDHAEPHERQRYSQIVHTFHDLFPRYEIEAVRTQPGSNAPEIQFLEVGRPSPLSFRAVSAGVHQILAMLVNVVARDSLILFCEHPEQHLHPHGIRFLRTLLQEASVRNQIILTTHDPHFVDPHSIVGLRRVWWTGNRGTCVRSISRDVSENDLGRIRTILRDLGNRELAFARSVIVVEDETQLEFLLAVAPTLGYQLDAHGVSMVPVNGEGGYRTMWGVLKALGVPYIALKDMDWGDRVVYPPERFFSFGMEIEEYFDTHGLKEKREKATREQGNSKRRAGRPLGLLLTKDEVPPIFSTILATAVGLATGDPAADEGEWPPAT